MSPGLSVAVVTQLVTRRATRATGGRVGDLRISIEDGQPVLVQEWVDAERLKPVRSDPNGRQLGNYWVRMRPQSSRCSNDYQPFTAVQQRPVG